MRVAAVAWLVVTIPAAHGARAGEALDREYEQAIARLEKRAASIPTDENASTHYMKAVAALPKGANGKLDDLICGTLYRASPTAMSEVPGAKDEVRRYKDAVSHLRRGAALQRCSFKLDWRKGAAMLLPHLAKLRDLARRAVCYAKLFESDQKPREAARVYLDIMRMGIHLDQDPALIHALVGIACTAMAAPGIEGLLWRGVDAETARLLLDGLRALPEPPFDAARAIECERVYFGGWARKQLLKEAEGGRERILKLFEAMNVFDDAFKRAGLGDGAEPHKPWKIPDDPEEIKRLASEAFEVYDRQMKLLPAAMEGSYHEALPRVERIARTQESYWKAETKEGHFAAAYVGMFTPAMSAFFVRVVRVEAHLRGLEILAASALAKAGTGDYPDSLESLAKHFPKGVPLDPFTGKSFVYGLAGNLPAVECEGDDPELKKKRPATYHFGFSYRRTLEKQELAKWRAERAKAGAEQDIEDIW